MNEGPNPNSNNFRTRHLVSRPISRELPNDLNEGPITSQTQLKEINQASIIKEEQHVNPQKSNKKIVALKPQKINVSRTQTNTKAFEREGERQTPLGTPSTLFRHDDTLSPTRSPSNTGTVGIDFLTEADLLLSRTTSMTVTSPIGKHSFTTRVGLLKPPDFQGYGNEYDMLNGGQSPLGNSPIYRPGSITHNFGSNTPVAEEQNLAERNKISQNIARRDSKKRASTRNGAIFVQEESKENRGNANSPEENPIQVPRIQLTPLNLDRSFVSDNRGGDRDVTMNNMQGDILDFGDVSRANVTHMANINADTTAAAILGNNNIQQSEQAQPNEQDNVNNGVYQPSESDIKVYLRRRAVFFWAMAIGFMFYNLMNSEKVSHHALFGILYFYLTYQLTEGIYGTYYAQSIESWQKIDYSLDMIYAICCIIAAIWVHLAFEDIVPASVLSCIPLLFSSLYYIFKTEAPDSVKRFRAGSRVFIMLQIVLITLKLDDLVKIEWTIAFIIAWIFLGVVAIHFFAYFVFCILLIFSIFFKQYRPGSEDLKIQFFGFLWHILYYGMSITIFIFLFGFIKAYDSKPDFRTLDLAILLNLILSGFLCIYTLIVFQLLTKFIKYYSMSNLSEGQESVGPTSKPRIKFQVEKKASYFVMLSSTYFLPLNHDLLAKNKKNLERIKVNIDSSPKNQWRVKNERQDNKRISVKTLQQYKENLDETWDKVLKKTGDETTKTTKSPKSFKMMSARFPDPPELDELEKSPFEIKVVKTNSKQNLSADDIENVQKLEENENVTKPDGEEKLCYLCYAQVPDAVLMNCGHGGICYECAIMTTKAKNECVECRAPIVAIHKVDPNPKMKDVLKSVEYSKVILEMQPRVQSVNG